MDIVLADYCNSPFNKLYAFFRWAYSRLERHNTLFKEPQLEPKIFLNPVVFVLFETCEVGSGLLLHLFFFVVCFCLILFTARKAVMCQDRAMAGILRPWPRLCRSTMIPSTRCILPESLRKRTHPIWHPTQPQNVSNAYCLSREPSWLQVVFYQQLRIVALNLFFAAPSDASTKLSHFLKVIDTHRLSFLMHWTEFLPHHAKADQPELP